jgi:DNA-binding transcriptional MerR regulator
MARMTGTEAYGSSEVCKIIGISHRQLEYWILIGVVTPMTDQRGAKNFKRFTEDDLWILKQVKELTDEGYLVSRAIEKLKRNFPERFIRGT